MKSLFCVNLNIVTVGLAIKTFGFPPRIRTLDSTSPNALAIYKKLKITYC